MRPPHPGAADTWKREGEAHGAVPVRCFRFYWIGCE